ncbi:MAG: transcription termination factor NusA [Actinomycetota bacterium]|nr:transcription termination factor NusA [Actinomycetota bacterium]
MASELMAALMALASEKDIDELYLLERLEQSLAKSYQNILNLDYEARVTIDRNSGRIYVFELVPREDSYDEETDEYTEFDEVDVTPSDVSRIAAQNAKAVINNIVREAGRLQIYREFADRKGELVTGTVLQTTSDFTILKIREGVEAELPHFDLKRHPNERNERPAGEYYQHNLRLKALVIDVRDPSSIETNARGESTRPAIVVSRTHPDLIRRLFELEVPEIYEGVAEIRSIAREPGARSKVAVSSRDSNLDPVGACVGPKGSRVRMVVSELRGERVDVIQWSDDPATYVANALSPAKVSSVVVDTETQYATVIVPDDQLSLAIGKEGQNARLAARLTGWHIDIKSASLVSSSMLGDMLIEEETDADDAEEMAFRCEYVSPQGIRCRNHAREGSRFCGIHDGVQAEDDEPEA